MHILGEWLVNCVHSGSLGHHGRSMLLIVGTRLEILLELLVTLNLLLALPIRIFSGTMRMLDIHLN